MVFQQYAAVQHHPAVRLEVRQCLEHDPGIRGLREQRQPLQDRAGQEMRRGLVVNSVTAAAH